MFFTDFYISLLKKFIGDGSEKAFNMLTYLEPLMAFKLKLTFSGNKQKNFLTHFLSIRGVGSDNSQPKQIHNILTKMAKIYEANGKKSELEWAAAVLIRSRVGEGYLLSTSMADLFDPSFISIMQALESKSTSNVAIAIKSATNSALSLKSSMKTSRFYSLISIALICGAFKATNLAYAVYLKNVELHPKKMEFVEFPELIFQLFSPIGAVSLYIGLFLCLSIFINMLLFENIPVGYRNILEEYLFPPALFYKSISSVRIFSSLSLLVSTIGMQTKDALHMLLISANAYEAYHLKQMIFRLQNGEQGTQQLDTGLLSKDVSLSLRMANEGESATVRSALHILSTEGQESLIKSIKQTSQFILVFSVISTILLVVFSGGLVLQVYMNLFL